MRAHLLDPDHAAIVRAAIDRGERDVWLVVEGRFCGRCRERTAPPGMRIACDNLQPPLPWADLAKPCETCGGTGHYVDDRGEQYEDACSEDDCRDGLPLVELRAAHRFEVGIREWRTCSSYDCPDCGDARGTVRLAVATVEVLPVVDPDAYFDNSVCYFDDTGPWAFRGGDWEALDLDRVPTPGRDFIVHLTLEAQ